MWGANSVWKLLCHLSIVPAAGTIVALVADAELEEVCDGRNKGGGRSRSGGERYATAGNYDMRPELALVLIRNTS